VKLHSPAFEKRLRHGVKAAVRRSPALRKDPARKYRWQYTFKPLGRPLVTAGLGFAIWRVVELTGHPLTGLAVTTLWAFAWIVLRARNLQVHLFQADDLAALAYLPMAEPEIFRWQMSKFYRSSATSLADLLVCLGVLALYVRLPGVAWPAVVPVAVLSWAVVVACSMLLAARWPGLPYGLASIGLYGFGLILWFSQGWLAPRVLGFVDRHALVLAVLLPPGWGSSQFLLLKEPRQWPVVWLLLPASLLLLTARGSLARLRDGYGLIETIQPEAPDIVPGEQPVARTDATPETPVRLDVSSIEDIILSRRFLAPAPPTRRDWFERQLHRWCDAREQVLADFLFPDGFPVLAPWTSIFRNLAIVVIVGLLLVNVAPTAGAWTVGVGLAAVSLQTLAQFLPTGTAFQELWFSGVKVHAYVAYGIGFRELSRFLSKISLVQFPLILIWLTGSSLLVGQLTHWPVAAALLIALKGSALVVASRFVLLTLMFSAGTNDTSRLIRAAPLLACFVLFGGGFLALSGGSVYVSHAAGCALSLLAVLDAYVLLRVYGWLYNGRRFDLMAVPRTR
jgi:hypothetical protein